MQGKGRRSALFVDTPSWRFGRGVYAIDMVLHWHGHGDLAPIMPYLD